MNEQDELNQIADEVIATEPTATTPNRMHSNRPAKVYGGMWGPLQIAAGALGLLALLAILLLYLFVVVPSNNALATQKTERDALEKEMIAAKAKYGDISNTETHVAKLVSSVNDFEANYLPVEVTGKTALYQRINGLINAYGLVNTAGPAYVPLELADQNPGNQSEEERGRARFRSLFPGIYVSTTVEGSYANLRRFINDLEIGQDFVVISSVQLEPSDTDDAGDKKKQSQQIDEFGNPLQTAPIKVNKGKTHGEVVRLRLEMAAYFRRPNIAPIAEAAPGT